MNADYCVKFYVSIEESIKTGIRTRTDFFFFFKGPKLNQIRLKEVKMSKPSVFDMCNVQEIYFK